VTAQPDTSYEFGAFRLVPAERQLLRENQTVTLPPKAFQALAILVQNHGHAVTKKQLIETLWPDAFVEESNLNHYISLVRKALGDGTNGERYIETLPKFGYRFRGDVRETNAQTESVLVHRHTRRHVVFKEEQIESLKTVSSRQVAVGRNTRARTVAALVILVLVVGTLAAYFGLIRSAHSPSAKAATAAAHKGSDNPVARDAYWKGRYYWNRRTPQDLNEAAKYFQAAIKSDPNYAQAYAGLADAYLLGGNQDEAEYSAEDLARKAIALDDSLGEAHASLAYNLSAVGWNWSEAERHFRRAIELDPNYATAHHWYAYHLASLGRLEEAKAEIRKARELNPDSVVINTDIAHILYLSRGYTQAIMHCRQVLEANPNFAAAHQRLAEAYTMTEMFDDAIAETTKARALGVNMNEVRGYLYATSGQRAKAEQFLEEMKAGVKRGEFNEVGIAATYAALDEKDEAFRWLDEAYRRKNGGLALVKIEPKFENLRSDPRFQALLKRMNLN